MREFLWPVIVLAGAWAGLSPAQPPPVPPPPAGKEEPPPVPAPLLIEALVEGLDDSDPEVRQNLAIALAALGSEAVPRLIEALKDPSPLRRAAAAYALGQTGADGAPAVRPLLMALKDGDREVRRQVSYALSRILAAPRPEVPEPLPPPPLRSTAGRTDR